MSERWSLAGGPLALVSCGKAKPLSGQNDTGILNNE